MTLQFRTPTVAEGWADSRETDDMVAMAIHAIADQGRTPEAIWDDPTIAEYDNVRMACENYLAAGLFAPSDDNQYAWGLAWLTVEPPEDYEPVPDASKLVDPNTYYNVETPVPGQTIGNVYLNTQYLNHAIEIATRLRLHVPEEIVIRLNSGGYVEGWEPKVIRGIYFDPPVESSRPTWDWWTFTTDHDEEWITLGVTMGTTADQIAAEIAASHLCSEDYTCNGGAALQGEPVTIHLRAPSGAETEHPATFT